MGTSKNGQPPFSLSDVQPIAGEDTFGSGGANVAPNQGVPAMGAVLLDIMKRHAKQVANPTALRAIVAADRADGQLIVTLDTYTLWTWEPASAVAADSTHVAPTDVGAGVGRYVALATTPQTLGNLGIQSGGGVLTLGASGNVAATITASSRIFIQRTGVNASTALGELDITNKTIGAPGHFVVEALDPAALTVQTGDLSSFDWLVVG